MYPAAAVSMPIDSSRRFTSPYHATPRTHLLSNGNYSVMLTAAGSGYSRWRDIALTRWREDPTCDPWGHYIFLRDVFNGHVWSAGYQPIGRESEIYEVAFFEDRAEIRRKDGPIRTIMEIFVSAEDDAEVRHLSLTNEGSGVREIELTSYSEVVLSPPAADSAHPAFSKMFVQTEFVAERGALLATRRPRDPGQAQLWMAHFNSLDGEAVGGLQFETDRARFHRPRARRAQCRIHHGGEALVQYRGHRARSGVGAAAPRAHRSRRNHPRRVLDRRSAPAAHRR